MLVSSVDRSGSKHAAVTIFGGSTPELVMSLHNLKSPRTQVSTG